ncbi:hypothetical protein MAPG_08051 [Magnaporthiopsis poae ATCC 64411]|uniref:SH3 domain-containing protein n=1 Tax=Magnaporthiopsis poae (strain ATCC 64411 / 73-15) TaxID=644358 RepID=A0A0C4E6B9_MAGP6|nr:hypothetical protein MAPG_08051 [Magnaporthiopsis poae ATCC 64411]
MTRPEIIRADSIDLQDRDAPSARDHHTRHPQHHPSSLAPHQAETLREVAAETAEENLRSPRVSWGPGTDVERQLQQYADDLAAGLTSAPEPATQANSAAAQARSNMDRQDALAIAQNGGHDVLEDDLDGNADDDGLDDDMMDKISSSPSIEDEDIDFEFVYALHTFVATVEGQANATKGDTMVLLDDSNSYWWLVRVVKDSSIGYLPAEHIETPTERLARLNKHRNIDLSASMLGDQAEKPKNPIKSAMRRRKAKGVTFAEPTYVDYSEIEYSTEEEDGDMDDYAQQEQQQQQQEQQQKQQQQQDQQQQISQDQQQAGAKQLAKGEAGKLEVSNSKPSAETKTGADIDGDGVNGKAVNRSSEEIFEASKSETPGPTRTKDGTVRDSFFKDETVETKKITLTPNLLRDDGAPRTSSESRELKQRPSLDKLEKDNILGRDDKRKKDKKDKDKKPSAIRSFFTRGGKKKSTDDDDESLGKRSMDSSTDNGHGRDLEDADDRQSPENASAPQRQPSKLQKQPRTEPSPTRKPGPSSREAAPDASTVNNVANVPPATMRIVDESAQDSRDIASRPENTRETGGQRSAAARVVPSRTQDGDSQSQMATSAKTRAPLDDSDSGDDNAAGRRARRTAQSGDGREGTRGPRQPQNLGGAPKESVAPTKVQAVVEPVGGSPVQISPATSNNPPALMGDTSSQEDQSSPISSPSPEPLDGDEGSRARHRKEDSVTTSTSTTISSTWNDTSLRAFFDSGSDIRDMLVVVYDKSDVAPAGPDHPVAGTLFREQNAKLAEITTQLDNMLGDWLARKQRLRGAV